MKVTDHERHALERLCEEQQVLHWWRWLALVFGVALCFVYWQSAVQLAQWTYSGSTESGSYPEVKYITMFVLGAYFTLTTLAHWRGSWRDRLLLKLARECGILKEGET